MTLPVLTLYVHTLVRADQILEDAMAHLPDGPRSAPARTLTLLPGSSPPVRGGHLVERPEILVA